LFTEEELAENGDLVSKYFKKTNKEAVRKTLDLGTRLDGRKLQKFRYLGEVDYFTICTRICIVYLWRKSMKLQNFRNF
jgi:hypothetical protein